MLADLLDRAEQHRELGVDGLRVLDGELPLAYCVPGRSPRVVLSGGALRVLERDQIDAVLAHEQAHLRHRHDVVMESLTAFYRAVPRPLRSRTPLDAVHLLLEMVADDAARKRCGAEPLRAALVRLSDAIPLGDVPIDGDRRRRLDRLALPRPSPALLTALAGVLATAILVLPTVILVVPWLDRALKAWPF
jgi:Zn-dependent protease with chaperone function